MRILHSCGAQAARAVAYAGVVAALSGCSGGCAGNGGFLSYQGPANNGTDADLVINACWISGPYAHVAIVEIAGESREVQPECPDPKVRKAYREWPVRTVDIIAGDPPDSFVAASTLLGDQSLPKSEVGDRFLFSLRHHDGMWKVAEWI